MVNQLSSQPGSSIRAPEGSGHFQEYLSNESNHGPVLAMAQTPAACVNVLQAQTSRSQWGLTTSLLHASEQHAAADKSTNSKQSEYLDRHEAAERNISYLNVQNTTRQ